MSFSALHLFTFLHISLSASHFPLISLYLSIASIALLAFQMFETLSLPPIKSSFPSFIEHVISRPFAILSRRIHAKRNRRKRSKVALDEVAKGLQLSQSAERLATFGPFTNLPIEIIQLILSYLSPTSQAAMTLTNKSLLQVIGTKSWTELASSSQRSEERTNFLLLLEKDYYLPDHWLCRDCIVFHHKHVYPRRCPAHTVISSFCAGPCTGLRWADIHLVMQRHLYGERFGLPIKALSENESSGSSNYSWSFREYVSSGKIVDGEVLIKLQITLDARAHIESTFFRICMHLRLPHTKTSLDDTEFQQAISCRLKHLRLQQNICAFCTPILRRCKWCAIEYELSITNSVGKLHDRRLQINVWANAGSGQHHSDPKWSILHYLPFHSDKRVEYELGSIRAKYEMETKA